MNTVDQRKQIKFVRVCVHMHATETWNIVIEYNVENYST